LSDFDFTFGSEYLILLFLLAFESFANSGESFDTYDGSPVKAFTVFDFSFENRCHSQPF
jgi:hypothetical protein